MGSLDHGDRRARAGDSEVFKASGLPSSFFSPKVGLFCRSRLLPALCPVPTAHHGLVCQSRCPQAPRDIESSNVEPAFQRGHHHLHFILGQITKTVNLSFPIC